MRNIVSLILVVIFAFGSFTTSASSAEWYTQAPNGRLTYHNDGRPGYDAPRRHYDSYRPRHYGHYAPRRHYRNDGGGEAALGLVLGLALGAAIVGAQNQQPRTRYAEEMTPEQQHCFDTGGVWLEDSQTRRQFCGWR